jgi:hypothetical protein
MQSLCHAFPVPWQTAGRLRQGRFPQDVAGAKARLARVRNPWPSAENVAQKLQGLQGFPKFPRAAREPEKKPRLLTG